MKVVIFAGGLGTRISEESISRPKPMIEIGGKPIIWHIMKIYAHFGYNDFVICLGYKGYMIKEYFINYFLYNSDLTVDIDNNELNIHTSNTEKFKVTLVDTGLNTNTAGRLKRIEKYVEQDPCFMLTYGDGVCNVNINDLVAFHKKHNKIATLTTIQLPGKYGSIHTDSTNLVTDFQEKPMGDGIWVNGGFFVLNKEVFTFLPEDSDNIQWEREPLNAITKAKQLVAYQHHGFWKSMDALRDKIELEALWEQQNAQWKIW